MAIVLMLQKLHTLLSATVTNMLKTLWVYVICIMFCKFCQNQFEIFNADDDFYFFEFIISTEIVEFFHCLCFQGFLFNVANT